MKQHLLIVRFSALGDVAMTVPVVYSLSQQYPDLHITVLSRGFARTFFEGLAENVSFMAANFKGEDKGMGGLNRLFRRLKAKNFTHVADFHDVLRSKYLRLCFMTIPTKIAHIDKHRSDKRRLTAKNSKQKHRLSTSFQNYADVLAELGFPIEIKFNSIFPPEGGNLGLLPKEIGMKDSGEAWIGIAPFAAHEGKILPLETTERVVAELNQRPYTRVMLFSGGGEERKVMNQWCEKYQRCTNVSALSASLMQEMIVMSHLNCMVSMDSGNSHLAAIAGTKVVSIWGATHPYAGFMAWNQDESNAVQIEMDCRPCSVYGNKPCHRGDYACLRNITSEQITEKINQFIHQKTKRL